MASKKVPPEIQALICERLAEGRALRAVCRDEDINLPASTVRSRLQVDEEFYAQYVRARNIGLDEMADELLDISDDGTNDFMTIETKHGEKEVVNHENIQRSRLRTDTRKWYLSKMAPKKYGERIHQEVSNPDGSLRGMSKDQIDAKLKQILEAAAKRKEAAKAADPEKEQLKDELL